MSVDSLGILVVPALALLLYRLLFFDDEPRDQGNGPGGPPAETALDVVPPRAELASQQVAVPALPTMAVLPMLLLGVLGIVILSLFSSKVRRAL